MEFQCAMWSTQEELTERVLPTLITLSETHPRLGWIRQTHAGLMDSLTETGISDVYTTREAAAERMFQDIRSSSQSCWISCAVHIRSLILPGGHPKMAIALQQASNRAGERGNTYRLSFCPLSDYISTRSLAGKRNASVLECWRQREGDPAIVPLQQRIERASTSFERLAQISARNGPRISRRASSVVSACLFGMNVKRVFLSQRVRRLPRCVRNCMRWLSQ
jgi:hypothetical protein